MRTLPNMAVFAPGDAAEVEWSIGAAVDWKGPAYVRLGKNSVPPVHPPGSRINGTRAVCLCDGSDLTLIATGTMLVEASQAAARLQAEGLSVRLLSMPLLKPFDAESVIEAARETGALVTVEEHSRIGGLGSAVADALVDADLPGFRLRCLALPPDFSPVGSQEFLLQRYGLHANGIADGCRQLLRCPSTGARASKLLSSGLMSCLVKE
jgi:transketolase